MNFCSSSIRHQGQYGEKNFFHQGQANFQNAFEIHVPHLIGVNISLCPDEKKRVLFRSSSTNLLEAIFVT